MSEESNNKEGKDGMEELEEDLRKAFSLGLSKEEFDEGISKACSLRLSDKSTDMFIRSEMEQLNITEDPYQNPDIPVELKELEEKTFKWIRKTCLLEKECMALESERQEISEKMKQLKEKYNIVKS